MSRSRSVVAALLFAVSPVVLAPASAPAKDDEATTGGHAAATKEAEPNIFAPRLDLTIWTIVVFVGLLLVLRKFAWGPMLGGLQGREARIRGALDEAHTARDEAQQIRGQLQAEMDKLHDKVRAMMDEARREAQQNKERMEAEARTAIETERDRARRDIQAEAEQAKQELWNQTARLATLVSAKVIGRGLDTDDHRRLVDEAVAELGSAPTDRTTA